MQRHYHQILAMDSSVTLPMEQRQIHHAIAATVGSPDQMLALPSSLFGDFLSADQAWAILSFPDENGKYEKSALISEIEGAGLRSL
jgi:hypothetical protein